MNDRVEIIFGRKLESKLKSIEYHLEVASNGVNNSAQSVYYAQADLRDNDVPFLLELVRSQAAKLEAQKKSLDTVGSIVNRFVHGELVNEGDGITWREPVEPLPRGIQEIHEALQDTVKDE